MIYLKQSTAVIKKLGPFVDSGDGNTAETGLTISQADIQLSKNGGAFAQTSDAAPSTTHDADGWYPIPLTTTDTGTLGSLVVQITESGALPVWREYMVVPANVYDSLVLGGDNLEVDITRINGALTDGSPAVADRPTLSLKELNASLQVPEFVVNGDFDTGDLTGWDDEDSGGGESSYADGAVLLLSNTGIAKRSNSAEIKGLVIGQTYILSGDAAGTVGDVTVLGAGGATWVDGANSSEWVADATSIAANGLSVAISTGAFDESTIDNISLREKTVPEVDIVEILGTPLTETSGQLAASFVKFNDVASPTGTINSLPDAIAGASGGVPLGDAAGRVDVSEWRGVAVAVPNVGGVPSVDVTYLMGTILEEASGGLLAAAFNKLFNVTSPTGTVNSLPDAVAGAAGGLFIAGTNAATAITTALTANIIGDITGNLSGSVGSLTGHTNQTGDNFARIGAAGASLTDLGGMSTGMKAEVNVEVDGALNTAIPGSPVADSINQRIKAIDILSEASGNGDLAAILLDTTSLNDTVLAEIVDATDIPAEANIRQVLTLAYMWLRNDAFASALLRRIKNNAGTVVLEADMDDSNGEFTQGKLGNP